MFTTIDALVLYALVNPRVKDYSAGIKELISFADYIDHSILTYSELAECLGRLHVNGLINVTAHSVYASPLYLQWRSALFKKKKSSVYTELKEIEAHLNLYFTISGNEEKELLDRDVYDRAVKEYLENGGSCRI